jgi:hypothetical protein
MAMIFLVERKRERRADAAVWAAGRFGGFL